NLDPLADFLYTFGDDFLTRLESFADYPLIADFVSNSDEPYIHFVVAIHNGDLITPLQFRDGTLRYQQRGFNGADRKADLGVLAGPQVVARIRKQPHHPDSAGFDVDLAIGKVAGPV